MKIYKFDHYYIIIIITFLLYCSSQWCYSAIINLPEDAPSLQEGVEMASDGDIIQINQHDVYFLKEFPKNDYENRYGIRIVNKDLNIVGTMYNERARVIKNKLVFVNYFDGAIDIPYTSNQNSFVIENSNVVIKNIVIESIDLQSIPAVHMIAATQIVSGKLILDNVIFNGLIKVYGNLEIYNSNILGDSYYHDALFRDMVGNKAFPSIHIRNSEFQEIIIENSQIKCDTDRGTRAILIEKIYQGNIKIANTKVISGIQRLYSNSLTYPTSYWDAPDTKKGLAGIFIVDCTNVDLTMTGSVSEGGGRDLSQSIVIPSGPGLEILNSNNINIFNGESRGHEGSYGYYNGFINKKFNGGDGGKGLFITNSTVHLYNHTAIGGKGGEGDPEHDILPGKDGEPIYHDENSEVIIETNVCDWMLYTK